MDTKKKPTKEEVAHAKKKLAEAKQRAADYDARMAEEKKKAPFPNKDDKVASFEDIEMRSSSSELPLNKGVKIRAEDLEKIEANKPDWNDSDWNDYNPDLYDPTIISKSGWFEGDVYARPNKKEKPKPNAPEPDSRRPEEVLVVEGMVPKGIAEPEEKGKKGKYEKRKPVDPKVQIMKIADLLLKSEATKYSDVEMEVKFGTRGIRRITKTDYDNVVKKLTSLGFITIRPEGNYSLKIQPEFLDLKSGTFKISKDFDRFRVEINVLENIQ